MPGDDAPTNTADRSRAGRSLRRGRPRGTTVGLAAGLVLATLLTGCGGGTDTGDATGATGAPATSGPPASAGEDGSTTTGGGSTTAGDGRGRFELVPTGAAVESPTDLVAGPDRGTVLVAARAGTVTAFTVDGRRLTRAEQVLDLRSRVGSTDGEKGLLGIAVTPDGDRLVASYTRAEDGASVVDSYPLVADGDVRRADRGGRRELLVVAQPFANHNGGAVRFGPDGHLYVGLGDGGAADDPEGNGQDLRTALGKVLRIEVDGDVPADNPFVDREGAEPRTWLRGVRNPWRLSFDPATGDLWIGDVGQNRVEEVDVLRAADGGGRGANLGWDVREGDEAFEDADPDPDGTGPLTDPVHTYTHDDGCSVTGGLVYRGTELPALRGRYLFADFCTPGLRSLDAGGGTSPRPSRPVAGTSAGSVVALGTDGAGEVYVLSLEGGVLRLAGGVPGAS